MGPIKAHQVLSLASCFGFTSPMYLTWGKVLSVQSSPHKFFEHLTGRKLDLKTSNEMFDKLLGKLKHHYSQRITGALLENLLCEMDRARRGRRKVDIMFPLSDNNTFQALFRVWNTRGNVVKLQIFDGDKWKTIDMETMTLW